MAVPRRIIQTQRDPSIQQELRQTWVAQHPGYEYLFFDDAQCHDLIATRLPHFLKTYDALPLPVQKADFFRYAAIHELGGLYVDVDTICRAPLHSYVDLSADAMVICPEMVPTEWPEGFGSYVRRFCIPQQFAQWAFCAPPGHPALALLLERIAYYVSRFSPQDLAGISQMDFFTLELTGPRVFTHVMNEFLSGSREGRIAELPRRTWGAWPWEHQAQTLPDDIKLTHLFSSAWWPSKQKQPPGQPQKQVRRAPLPKVNFNIRY
ncbi:glycosyltransferase family 32 protein [Variovorax sp. VNK109]|uniref:glycosyltransferase family 32 protein n=1 Tax=Variovorax sp. VNK109 TaxID=3400919 RepID=UPI003C09267D